MNSKKKLERNEFQELVIDTKKKEKISKKKADMRWIIKIILIAFTLSFCLSYVSQVALPKLQMWLLVLRRTLLRYLTFVVM